MKKKVSFSLLLPLVGLFVSAGLVLVPAFRAYLHLKAAQQTVSTAPLGDETYQIVVPANKTMYFAVSGAALREQGPIILLNAPGHFVYLLVSRAAAGTSNWYPSSLGPALWRVLTFPFFAIPAWIFAGRGFDGMFRGKRMHRADLAISLVCAALFLFLSVGLRFGLSNAEREGQLLLNWYIAGFGLWTILIGMPLAAWLRARFSTTKI
jgi:hypothetical protein